MTLKSLSTQFNEIVFLQHIQTIKIEDAGTYFKSVGYPDNYRSSYETVLTATLPKSSSSISLMFLEDDRDSIPDLYIFTAERLVQADCEVNN